MLKQKRSVLSQTLTIFTIILGIVVIVISVYYVSSFLAIFGLTTTFWGVVFLYITPTRCVPITMFNMEAETTASIIERIINRSGATSTGIYLPPRNLENTESLVFIPRFPIIPFSFNGLDTALSAVKKSDVTVIPPGAGLCKIFEQELNVSFIQLDLNQLRDKLPKLLVEDMELAEMVEIQIQENSVIVEIRRNILDEICKQTDSNPRTHKQVGCLMSSAIACALAKCSGKPVFIKNESREQDARTTRIEYQILGE